MPTLIELLALMGQNAEDTDPDQPSGFRLSDAVSDPMQKPQAWQTAAPDELFRRGDPVGKSTDLDRVLALPRRPVVDLTSDTAEAMVELEMRNYARDNPNCDCKRIDPQLPGCLNRLLPMQAWMLREIRLYQGLLASAATGGGKCCHGDTEIMDYSTGRRRRVDEPGDLAVASFDGTLRIQPAAAFPSGTKECVEVALRNGTALKLSTDHPVLTHRGWVHAAELTTSDFAAVAMSMPEPPVTTLATDAEVKFLAMMLSDGGCSQSTMGFTNMTPQVIEDWTTCAQALGYRVTEVQSRSRARQFNLSHNNKEFRARWDLHGLSKDKRLHPDLWGLPDRQVALFLNRFWACDGHVSVKSLELTLASEKMIDDVRFLLLRLGIQSGKAYKTASYTKDGVRHTFDAWRIHIAGVNAYQFFKTVGVVLGKEEASNRLIDKLTSTTRNANYDTVPLGAPEFGEICDELGWNRTGPNDNRVAARRQLSNLDRGRVSRSRFIKFCRDWHYTGKYSHLASTDVGYVRVSGVTPIGPHPVYDLSVPGTHNFVANGVVIHNTLVGILAPLALTDVQQVLMLIPPSLVDQIQHDYQLAAQHFNVPGLIMHIGSRKAAVGPLVIPGRPTLHVMPYSRLSLPDESDFLTRLQPDAIICDEVDSVRSMQSSRGIRLAQWFAGGDTPEERAKRQSTKFLGWTGSLTDHSITEFNFLSLFALRDKSPLPLDPVVVEEWGRCLDATTNPSPPGELLQFCSPGEDVRHAFRRRLAETPGFVVANTGGVELVGGESVQLSVTEKQAPPLPPIIETALAMVRKGIRPDTLRPNAPDDGTVVDEELEDALAIAQAAQQVSTGVLYYWTFPNREPAPLIKAWMQRKRAYNREVREKTFEGQTFLDSAMLCEHAAMRFWGDTPQREDRPDWRCESWPAWRDIREQVKPKPESCVLHDFLVEDAIAWGEAQPGIIWYTMRALATRMQELSGLPVHDGGAKGGDRLRKETGARSIICSIRSNGRGRNGLQYVFDRQLIVNPPASATGFEQLLARTHRRWQKSNLVTAEVYMHTPELRKAVDQALRRSEYVKDILGADQKLLDGWEG